VKSGIQQFDLSDKTILLTGGSKGLGKSMAEGLASAGANLALVSRNQKEVLAISNQSPILSRLRHLDTSAMFHRRNRWEI